jgi:hypothetical protein
MGANQNSSRNLAYIQESTQIHITQNPAVLKPRLAVEHRSKNERTNNESDSKKNSGREIVVRARVLLFGKMEPTTSNLSGDGTRGRSFTSELTAKTEKVRKDRTCR